MTQFREMLTVKEGMGLPMVEVDDIGRPTFVSFSNFADHCYKDPNSIIQ